MSSLSGVNKPSSQYKPRPHNPGGSGGGSGGSSSRVISEPILNEFGVVMGYQPVLGVEVSKTGQVSVRNFGSGATYSGNVAAGTRADQLTGRVDNYYLGSPDQKPGINPRLSAGQNLQRLRQGYGMPTSQPQMIARNQVVQQPIRQNVSQASINQALANQRYSQLANLPMVRPAQSGSIMDMAQKAEFRASRSQGLERQYYSGQAYVLGAGAAAAGILKNPLSVVTSPILFAKGLITDPFGTGASIKQQLDITPAIFAGQQTLYAATPTIAGKLYRGAQNLYVKASAKPINIKVISEKNVITGVQQFPLSRSVPESLRKFREVDGVVVSASPQKIKGNVVGIGGELSQKQLQDPGLYTTPKGRASPHFLEVNRGYDFVPDKLTLLPKLGIPTLTEFITKGIRRQPESVRIQPGFKAVSDFLQEQGAKQSGNVFLTKRSEVGLGGSPGKGVRMATSELEAVIAPGQKFQYIKPQKGLARLKGFDSYFMYEGRAVPIRRAILESGKTFLKADDGLLMGRVRLSRTSGSYGSGSSVSLTGILSRFRMSSTKQSNSLSQSSRQISNSGSGLASYRPTRDASSSFLSDKSSIMSSGTRPVSRILTTRYNGGSSSALTTSRIGRGSSIIDGSSIRTPDVPRYPRNPGNPLVPRYPRNPGNPLVPRYPKNPGDPLVPGYPDSPGRPPTKNPFFASSRGSSIDDNRAYDALIKRKQAKKGKGKYSSRGYKKINSKPLTKSGALGLGMIIADKFSNRTFKIQPAKGKPQRNMEYETASRSLAYKFRSKRNPNMLTEKTSFAIDSRQEKDAIPYEAQRQRKAGKFRKKSKAWWV